MPFAPASAFSTRSIRDHGAGALRRVYDDETLSKERARQVFVLPRRP